MIQWRVYRTPTCITQCWRAALQKEKRRDSRDDQDIKDNIQTGQGKVQKS